MAERGQESPMEFEWENKSGRVDENSPWKRSETLGQNSPWKSTPSFGSSFAHQTPSRTRPQGSLFSTLQSSPPKQPSFSTPSAPLFGGYSTPSASTIKPPQFRAPAFTTPRPASPSKSFSDLGTPLDGLMDSLDTESEATPGMTHVVIRRGSRSTSKALRSTTPTRITGRGEIPRGRFHSGSITKPRRRRHHRSQDFDNDSDDYDSGDESEYSPRKARSRSPKKRHFGDNIKPAAEEWVKTHKELPLIISQYLQIFFNTSLMIAVLYALGSVLMTIRRDVKHKVEEHSSHIIQAMALCEKDYIENRCAPYHLRVPGMREQCAAWERCMEQDPAKIGWAKLSAVTFAEILNGFTEGISYKTMFFVLALVLGSLFVSNFAFGYFRARLVDHPHPYTAAAVPPMANEWTPHPSGHAQRPWETPSRRAASRNKIDAGEEDKQIEW